MAEKLIVSSSPHIRSGVTTRKIMLDVIIALTPAAIASVIIFGFKALVLILCSVASCVLSEYVCRKVMKRENTIGDLSAVVTGILLAFNVPVGVSPFIVIFGGIAAIVVVKQMFGGIGQNFVNPALTARIILMSSFPAQMSSWNAPFYYLHSTDAMTTASPLGILKEGASGTMPTLLNMLVGARAGCLGETCAVALILGGIYLVVRGVISPVIPLCYIGSVAVISLIAGRNVLFDLLAGGLLLGAIFMATDYATSPINLKGKIVFAVGAGVITMLIRVFGQLPEGVSFSIILMNLLVPHIERLTRPRAFGKERVKVED
ncbi:RnfABCDGE type electron transport complex subunit D [Caproiciproducens sp. R2]|uniref:RnfABCDGE type electron transport complex subunit D n=1 Tax=Caproiciproducens sp. R2 TaxID=3435187 RepID=UPI0040340E02